MPTATIPSQPPPSTPAPGLVRVHGEPRDLGLQQGALLSKDIRAAVDVLVGSEAFELLRPGLVPRGLFRALAQRRGERLLSGPVLRARPDLHARALGIAAGAGVPERAVWLIHAAELLLAGVDWSDRPPPRAS